MRTDEIREYGDEDLSDRILEMEEELFRLRIQNKTGQLDNPLLIRSLRRDLARCKTIRRQREREERV